MGQYSTSLSLQTSQNESVETEQEKLFSDCINEGLSLSKTLKSRGMNYNDLSYQIADGRKWSGKPSASLQDFTKTAKGIPFVSFFTGCGGFDLGMEAIGFHHIAGFELNELFCKTLRANRPDWKIFGPPSHSGDISKVQECVDALEPLINEPFEGLFVGGPPCQPFSIAANQRFSKSGDNFKRTGFGNEKKGNLLFDYMTIVLQFRPKVFVIENVPGLRDIDGGQQLNTAIESARNAGYTVPEPKVLDASDFGIPQNRKRLIVIGYRTKQSWEWPEKHDNKIGCGSVLANPKINAPNNETREHNAGSVKRYARLDYGKRDQLGRVDRLDPLLPSKTVIAGGLNGGGRSHLHPDVPRTLSVRECARLQTFPDDYIFKGPTARQFTQVGNAVPPVLAAELGTQLVKLFSK